MPYKLPADQRCALITRAIEIDLRDLIKEKIIPLKKIEDLIHPNILQKINDRITKEIKSDFQMSNKIDDNDFVDYFDYGTALDILKKNKAILEKKYSITFEKYVDELIKIKPVRDFSIHGRILLASHLDIIENFSEKITKKNEIIFDTTIKQINSLKDKTFEDSYEFENLDERDDNNNLPRPDTNETGYIERLELNQRINKVLNNYPVISFIGDAGTGKTATAIKKGYDLALEDKFDIIWFHSFKTEKFSLGEIKQIKNDINTTDKFLLSSLKIGDYDKDPIKNLVKYLEKNKVLLILDNLETVLDQNILNFLDYFAEAEHESKVILTSRIPVNRGDMAIKVGSFKDHEAIAYFRKLLNFYDLKHLHETLDEKLIKKLIKKRSNNPLQIKLSIGAVSGGKSIEDAFKDDVDLLNFCYTNVFDTFSDTGKKILECCYHLNRELNLSDICLLLENIEPNKISLNLRDLVSKNFIVSNLKKSETSYFIIRREVIPFLEKNKIFEDENKKKDIFGKFTKMTAATTFMDVNIDRIDELKSHWDEILIRKNSDKFAGMQLRNANRIMKSKQNILGSVAYKKEALTSRQREKMESFDKEFLSIISNLKKTHPDYCEVFRVEAIYHLTDRDTANVINCFEKAINLQPDYPNLRTFYATSLRQLDDLENSLKIARENYGLYPNRLSDLENLILAKYFNKENDDELKKLIIKLKELITSNRNNLAEKELRKSAMRVISYYTRRADHSYFKERNLEEAFNYVKKTFEEYDEYKSNGLVDYFTVYSTINKTNYVLRNLASEWRNKKKESSEIRQYIDRIRAEFKEFPNMADRRRNKVVLGGTYIGKFWHDTKNHFKENGGGYIVLEDSYIEEYGITTFKIYIRESNLPEEIKKLNGRDRSGKYLKFKVEKLYAPKKSTYYLSATNAEISDFNNFKKGKLDVSRETKYGFRGSY